MTPWHQQHIDQVLLAFILLSPLLCRIISHCLLNNHTTQHTQPSAWTGGSRPHHRHRHQQRHDDAAAPAGLNDGVSQAPHRGGGDESDNGGVSAARQQRLRMAAMASAAAEAASGAGNDMDGSEFYSSSGRNDAYTTPRFPRPLSAAAAHASSLFDEDDESHLQASQTSSSRESHHQHQRHRHHQPYEEQQDFFDSISGSGGDGSGSPPLLDFEHMGALGVGGRQRAHMPTGAAGAAAATSRAADPRHSLFMKQVSKVNAASDHNPLSIGTFGEGTAGDLKPLFLTIVAARACYVRLSPHWPKSRLSTLMAKPLRL